MLKIPFKTEWPDSFPKARKVNKSLDFEAWEKIANPDIIYTLAKIFIIPGYMLALLLILIALYNGIISSSPHVKPKLVYPASTVMKTSNYNK
jgi:hypothetical protein